LSASLEQEQLGVRSGRSKESSRQAIRPRYDT
jgi:hypothetical protein